MNFIFTSRIKSYKYHSKNIILFISKCDYNEAIIFNIDLRQKIER